MTKLFLTILIALVPATCFAQSYTWENESGTLVFGNKPPKGARNVKKLKTKPLSRYSADKVLESYSRSLAPTPKEIAVEPIPAEVGAPPKPAQLEQGNISMALNEAQQVVELKAELHNNGDLTARNVVISFEFENGTIVPALGPEEIAGNASETFSVAEDQLPITAVPEGSPVGPQEPNVIIQFSEG